MRPYKDHGLRRRRRRRPIAALAALSLTVLTLSAPAATAAPGPGATAKLFKEIGPAKANTKTLSLAKNKQGIFAIATNGHSLYVYTKDKGAKSACTGTCAEFWPAYTHKGPITTGVLIKKSEVGRADGQKAHQVTYYGHLLYFYKGDKAPGQTNGVGKHGFHLIGPFGNIMKAVA